LGIVDLAAIVKALDLKVRCGADQLNRKVTGGFTGDLLSDVMAHSGEGDLWITRQVHQNIIAVASLKDHAGIVLVQGSEPAADTLDKAVKEGVPILVSERSGFETAGRIYEILKVRGEESP